MPTVVRRAVGYATLLTLLFCSLTTLGQAPVPSSKEGRPARGAEEERDNPAARQAWFLKGRIVPGKNAAALLHRAFQQKQELRRAQRQRAAGQAGTAPPSGTSGTVSATSFGVTGPPWTNLGPAPITGFCVNPPTCTSYTNLGFSGNPEGNFVGRITAVAVDPNDTTGNTVYVGGAYGGVWKSTNAGPLTNGSPSSVTWTALYDTNAAASTLSVGAIGVQPGGTVVLVGTGEPNNAIDSYYGQGILRSADSGATWSLISSANSGANSFKGIGFSSIAFDTDNTSLVVAGGAQTPLGSETHLSPNTGAHSAIYTSTDAGLTWSQATANDPGPTAITFARVTDVVYDHGGSATGLVQKFYAAVAFHGFYWSSDGLTWTRLPDPPGSNINTTNCPATPTSANCPLYRGGLTVQPSTGDLYAVLISDATNTNPQIFRATFSGGQVSGWLSVTNTAIVNCGDNQGGCGTGGQGFYDLYVAAVPNGGNTDLYFGAVNLFKCAITSSNPTCGNNAWLNVTHVYSTACGTSYQTMHPDNHALDYPLSNPSLLYFGNDGGVYRTFSGPTLIGTCGTSGNPLDDLNTPSLGSLSQFIAISTDAADGSVTLGGTQDNGSPAIAGGQSSPPLNAPLWFEANGGDGGFNFIDHTGTNWYTAFTDVSIQKCSSGTACIETQPFQNSVTGTQVGGDHGDFYTPYIPDPANDANVIVGTCRVWRGVANVPPTPLTALSNNFDTGVNSQCTVAKDDMIRSLAAGGPTDNTNHLSQVIYAGTGGGRIWVTTNASGGPGTWQDRSGCMIGCPDFIDPNSFPISGVAIDMAGDATGQTAYLTIMGFTGGTGHVWKTTNAGVTWTDITGNLPDAPVNAVLIDPANHNIVYVGTDVGVFMTSAVNGASTVWSEWGTNFPNVAVVSLAAAPGGLLRAGTHGRGVFENQLASGAPYTLTISNSPQTVYLANLPAVFDGSASTTTGFSSLVDLSCTAGSTPVPATCTPSPTPLTPTAGAGTALTVTASDVVGDYLFNLHGVGQDVSHTVENAPITLHIIDFDLGAPSPTTISVPHNLSNTTSFTVTAHGSFTDTVTLSCSGQPAGVTCSFSPNNFTPSNGGTAVTLTVSAAESAAVGSYAVTIQAKGNLPGAPTKTQPLTVNVTLNPDFALASSASLVSRIGQTGVTGAASITYLDGYTNTVNLGCTVNATGIGTCGVSPASTTGSAALTVSVDAGTAVAGNYSLTLTGSDGTLTHSILIPYAIWDYSVLAPASNTASSGDTSEINFTLHLLNGAQNVDVSCNTNIAGATCAVLQGSTPVVNPVSLAGGDVGLIAALTMPAGPNPCGSGAGCTVTVHTTDHDVPTTAAHDAVVDIFPPVTASNDFNGDGKADILWQNSSTGDVVVWLMNGATRTSSALVVSGVDPNWKSVGVGDFDGDGKADILWQNSSTGGVVVWLMNGATKTSSAFVAQGVDPSWKIVGVGDFDGDGKADILWRNSSTGSVVVWLMNGATRTSSAFVAQNVDPSWQIVGVGDFDGDGKADILWRNTTSGDLVLWFMNGATRTSSVLVAGAVSLNLQVIGVGDFSGGGKADIVWRNSVTGDVVMWLMNGATVTSTGVVVSAVDPAWQVFGISDFDGDGKSDILWRNSTTGSVVVWLMNGVTKLSSAFVATGVDPSWQIVPFTHQ